MVRGWSRQIPLITGCLSGKPSRPSTVHQPMWLWVKQTLLPVILQTLQMRRV
jgi:hypothetical protein